MSRYERLYNVLKSSGELQDLFPAMIGEWGLDKKNFIAEQQLMEEVINVTEIDLDEQEDSY